ncbi:uroporphyrinogen-III synthase [Galbitalea soli]|uniref:Uroporphyrinogen-III synthase n=1 Tax=Galbitalea soli TaxID=1268042 RepID=A0A7C9PMF4_9MICO|nr:uroporphyrinogen-III synthase [Galbitalea soli]NEM90689.1 uroporphyrinogen-III synthase [Galbitalea soli]NYJ31407.1 uroporphyrinogen-III synthase [Galbitalea soli]
MDDPTVAAFRPDQLDGFRIGVTSDRRSEDLIDAFERRGATVLHAPTLRIAHAQHDDPILDDTRAVIAARPEILLASTGYGIRRWFEVADAAGLGDALLEALSGATILVRGPKARGGIRAAGLNDSGMSEVETTASLVTLAMSEYPDARTIAVQLHGYTDEAQLARLRVNHEVLTVAPYRWSRIDETNDRVQRLIEATCSRQLDAVTFTSAPSVDAFLIAAEALGQLDAVVAALQGDVLAAVVGPVTAGPLLALGITPIQPDRFRMGALIRLVCEYLETQRVARVSTHSGELVLRGSVAVVGGTRVPLAPTSVALLRQLMETPGAVLSRSQLAVALPGIQDDHAMEVALSRLRASLGAPGLVSTVVKRGYRLNV